MANKTTNELMTGPSNIFMDIIYNKKPHSLSSYLKYRKMIKTLKKATPDFDMLIQIDQFVKYLNLVYFYNQNMEHCIIFPVSDNSTDGSFVIKNDTLGISISFKLFNTNRIISIHITRKSGCQNTILKFSDGQAVIKSAHEENLFINVTNILMDEVIRLLKYYYSNKRRGY